MKDPGSYANPINSSFQKCRTTSLGFDLLWRWQYSGRGARNAYQRALWVVVPPLAFVYGCLLLFSTTGAWNVIRPTPIPYSSAFENRRCRSWPRSTWGTDSRDRAIASQWYVSRCGAGHDRPNKHGEGREHIVSPTSIVVHDSSVGAWCGSTPGTVPAQPEYAKAQQYCFDEDMKTRPWGSVPRSRKCSKTRTNARRPVHTAGTDGCCGQLVPLPGRFVRI